MLVGALQKYIDIFYASEFSRSCVASYVDRALKHAGDRKTFAKTTKTRLDVKKSDKFLKISQYSGPFWTNLARLQAIPSEIKKNSY